MGEVGKTFENQEGFLFRPKPALFGPSRFLRKPADGAAPGSPEEKTGVLFLQEAAHQQAGTLFLQEAAHLQAGAQCNFFCMEAFVLEGCRIRLDAEISLTERCSGIRMYAELYDVNSQKEPLRKFEIQEKKGCDEMHYVIDETLDSSIASIPRMDLEVVVSAELQDASGTRKTVSISESAEYDIAKWDVVRPRVEAEGYITYPGGRVTPRTRTGSDDKIVIALYRTPDAGTNDLDYLCEYGKKEGQPWLMIPGDGAVTFQETGFKLKKDSVSMICYLLKPGGGGAYLLASGDVKYKEEDIEIRQTPISVVYRMYNRWNCAFMEKGDNKKHEFIYRMDLSYQREDRKSTRHVYLADDKDKKPPVFGYVPHLLIQWGCLEEGTRIRMADGTQKAIRDIARGEKVLLADGETAPVCIVWRGEDDVCCRIVTESGREILAGRTHPFLTAKGVLPAKALARGNVLMVWDEESGGMKEETIERAEEKKGTVRVCNLSLGGAQMIANGFICGDMEQQNHRQGTSAAALEE